MAEDNSNHDRLISDFNAASSNIRKIVGGAAAVGAEKKYGQTYQNLVKAGLRPQLRKKYR
jgi:hypothetical protein